MISTRARSQFLYKTAEGTNYAVYAVHVLLLLERVQSSRCVGCRPSPPPHGGVATTGTGQ